jgi:hypothetical protein
LVVGAAVVFAAGKASVNVVSDAGVGCDTASKAPEVYQFYGDTNTVLKKVEGLNVGLAQRRLYVLTVESSTGAELRVFEKASNGKGVEVSSWKGSSLGDLNQQLAAGLLENKGVNCVGEQSKALITAKLGHELKTVGTPVPAPVSAKAAFAHPVQDFGGQFVRATVFLLC